MISYIDEKLGRLMDTLERTGLADNTIVVMTADHGEMMGERGMWFKQHFFEWAARVPLIVSHPGSPGGHRVSQNVSLIDLMPTLLDAANGGSFEDYVSPLHGTSLTGALEGNSAGLPDVAISEFAADGSTGPSRMVKKGPWKYMYLEGVDEVLYQVEDDPQELVNLVGSPEHAEIEAELRAVALDGWDPEALRETIAEDQRCRLKIHKVTGGDPSYVNIVRSDDATRYIRNAGAADTKARARLPYVPPASPDRAT